MEWYWLQAPRNQHLSWTWSESVWTSAPFLSECLQCWGEVGREAFALSDSAMGAIRRCLSRYLGSFQTFSPQIFLLFTRFLSYDDQPSAQSRLQNQFLLAFVRQSSPPAAPNHGGMWISPSFVVHFLPRESQDVLRVDKALLLNKNPV